MHAPWLARLVKRVIPIIGGGHTKPGAQNVQTSTQLGISTQPSASATSGSALGQQPVIQILDANNQVVTTATDTVVASVNTGTSTLSGTTSKAAVAGVATYTDLVLTGADTDTLHFASGSLTAVNSNSIVVNASSLWRANEPAGMTTIDDLNWNPSTVTIPQSQADQAITGLSPWRTIYNTQHGGGGNVSTDATMGWPSAPRNSGNIYVVTYPNGFTGSGVAPNTLYRTHTAYKKLYVCFYWFVPSPWQFHPSNVNKIHFEYSSGINNCGLQMYGSSFSNAKLVWWSEYPSAILHNPNQTTTIITSDTWHLIEMLVDYNAATAKWWLDGILQGIVTSVPFPADSGFQNPHLSPTWGGVSGTNKSETDYYGYNGFYRSGV